MSPIDPPSMESEKKLIIHDDCGVISLKYGEFEADGFKRGYTLFEAFRQAINRFNNIDINSFIETIKNNQHQLNKLSISVQDDFYRTLAIYEKNYDKKELIHEWCCGGNWEDRIMLWKDDGISYLVYAASGDDYRFGWASGWDSDELHPTILDTRYCDIRSFNEKYVERSWSNLTEVMAYDEQGVAVFLVEAYTSKDTPRRFVEFLMTFDSEIISEKEGEDIIHIIEEYMGKRAKIL
jgi:hypothetical protein